MPKEEHLLTETDGEVGIIRINRPKVLNALNLELMTSLADLLEQYDADDSIVVILLAGGERAWAAGADIGDAGAAARGTALDQFRDPNLAVLRHLRVLRRHGAAAGASRRHHLAMEMAVDLSWCGADRAVGADHVSAAHPDRGDGGDHADPVSCCSCPDVLAGRGRHGSVGHPAPGCTRPGDAQPGHWHVDHLPGL